MSQRSHIVTALRRSVAKIDGTRQRLAIHGDQTRLRFGIDGIDAVLGGGLAPGDMHEIRCSLSRDIGSATGFLSGILSNLEDDRPIVWLGDPSITLDTGNLFPDGLVYYGVDASRLIHIRPMHLNDCLWAAGEAARTGGLTAVVLHIKGNPNAFDLSVSRKLMLRAQTSKTPLFILRQAGEEESSSAATRWHIEPASSQPDEIYNKGVGHMRLTLTLEKNRNGQTGQWLIAWNPLTRSFENAAHTFKSKTNAITSSELWASPTASSELWRNPTAKAAQPAHSMLSFHPSGDRQDCAPEMGEVVETEGKRLHAS